MRAVCEAAEGGEWREIAGQPWDMNDSSTPQPRTGAENEPTSESTMSQASPAQTSHHDISDDLMDRMVDLILLLDQTDIFDIEEDIDADLTT